MDQAMHDFHEKSYKRGWIKCDDEMPPMHSPVFLYLKDKEILIGEYSTWVNGTEDGVDSYGRSRRPRYVGLDETTIGRWISNGCVIAKRMNPTHWMAMPSPPDGEEFYSTGDQ